MMILHTKFYKS